MDDQALTQSGKVIRKFGGVSAMARLAGFPKTTVQRWKESGRINHEYNDRILEAAAENGIALTVEDFSTVDPSHPLIAREESPAPLEAAQ